jgi:uncharacterized membrane protein HdeD (DUF308 family)
VCFGALDTIDEEETVGIGLGIVLLLVGLVLALGVIQMDLSFIDDVALGWILVVVGALAIVLALVMNRQRARSRHVEERRIENPPR